jgi:hypothetical protein
MTYLRAKRLEREREREYRKTFGIPINSFRIYETRRSFKLYFNFRKFSPNA